MTSLFTTLDELNIYSLYGPKHKEQVDAICAKLGADSASCCNFRKVVANFPQADSNGASTVDNRGSATAPVRGEISVKQYYHLWQNAYNKGLNQFSDTFATDGWTKTPTPYSVANAQLYQFYKSPKTDAICDKAVQQKWIVDNFNNSSNAYTLGGVDFGDNRTHYNMVGDEDPIGYGYLNAMLGQNIDTSSTDLFPFPVDGG